MEHHPTRRELLGMGAAGWLGLLHPFNTDQGRPVTAGGAEPRIRIAVSTYSYWHCARRSTRSSR